MNVCYADLLRPRPPLSFGRVNNNNDIDAFYYEYKYAASL